MPRVAHASSTACLESGCACCTAPQPAAQSLKEVEFARSACAAAQTGNVERLARLLAQRPICVHSDGASGARLLLAVTVRSLLVRST